MKPREYIKAVIALIEEGQDPDAVLRKLQDLLDRTGRNKLYPRILKGVLAALTHRHGTSVPVVRVARTEDIEKHAAAITEALERLQAPHTYETEIDDALIGGFSAEYAHAIIDTSYKRTLVSLYRRVTK